MGLAASRRPCGASGFRVRLLLLSFGLSAALCTAEAGAADYASTNQVVSTNDLPLWLTQPLHLADALNIAEAHNANVLKAKQDLEAQYGVAVQTKAIVLPASRSRSPAE
jgi:hypothetical protein